MWIVGGFRRVYPQSFPTRRARGGSVASVRQLLPTPLVDVDPLRAYPHDARPAPSDRPWVMLNMVTSVDGGIAINGRSGGLGGVGDAKTFRAIRASCDWILVAAGTARAERYGVPRPAPDVVEVRLATGRARAARLAVVTASVDLDPSLPMFADQRPGDEPPLIITGAAPPADRVAALADVAEFVHLAADRPSPRSVVDELHRRGATVVLAEGGPTWNGQLAQAGLIDELCLTISPHLVGGASLGILGNTLVSAVGELILDRLLEHDGALFARYLRA